MERFNSITIRWRLALTSAFLTFVILAGFAVVIGEFTARGIRSDFNNSILASSDRLTQELKVQQVFDPDTNVAETRLATDLATAAVDGAAINVFNGRGGLEGASSRPPRDLGSPFDAGVRDVNGYRVNNKPITVLVRNTRTSFSAIVQYALPLSNIDERISTVRTFLLFGVLAGTGLALAAGLMLARRAMAPISQLTLVTREIARTRDPNRSVPVPDADDEVAELAHTLDGMLQALESSRREGAEMLNRQRQFVADASHELRTPLTSVLANLEILEEVLQGDDRDIASSALRSTQRMRRLVADLLLLARADGNRTARHEPIDLQGVLYDVAGELGPIAQEHELVVDAEHAVVDGARDELHRVVLNLMDNAIKHTPPGTTITAGLHIRGDRVLLTVADDGPGVAPELRDRLFERFVRGEGDRGGSFGLGLSIVRAVARAHGGSVTLTEPETGTGTIFAVELPLLQVEADEPVEDEPEAGEPLLPAAGAGRLWSSGRRPDAAS